MSPQNVDEWPGNTVSASGTRDSLRHALGAALERAERAEAAAEEARQERERLRDAAAGELAKRTARIGELEAALRERDTAIRVYTSDLHRCSTRPCSCGAYTSLRALQPTTDPALD